MPQRTIAVIDGNSLLHRAFHALPETMTAPDGRPTNAAFGFLSMLLKLIADVRPDGVVVAFDRGKPAFRTEALAQYKVHRPPTAEALRAQFPMVKTLIEALDVPIVEIEGWEGDDILGTLASRGDASGLRMLLVTGDRDAFQLVGENVRVVTTRKGITDIAILGPDDVFERYGVTAAQVPDYLGLKGDTSDNIPGVPGVGEKTASKLLQEHGTLDAVLDAARQGLVPGKVGANLVEFESAARASRTVATIACDVPIELDLEAVTFGQFDSVRVAEAFGALRFTSLLERAMALRGAGAPSDGILVGDVPGAGAAIETAAAEPSRSSPCLTGSEATSRLDEWLAAPDATRLGVAFGQACETLFDDQRDLAIAGPADVAIVSGDAAQGTLAELFSRARVATSDAKALIHEICPADESQPCDHAGLDVDPARLFDVGIAAYLLESNRSDYGLASLSADYLNRPIPATTQEYPDAAAAARASVDLADELELRLEADGSLEVLRRIELPLVPVLARMERTGVGLDTAVLERLAVEARESTAALRDEIHTLAGGEFLIDSPKQLAEVLFDRLGLPTQKKTKTGYSTDASVLATLAPLHPIAQKVVAYRELTKLTSTYLEALPRMLGGDGRLHTSFNQTVAATGRLSSSNPNLQNIPVRTELGRKIRAAFVPAAEDDVMVSADYSQIELRILAHLSEDEGLIEAFTSGADFHAATAARVFGVDVGAVEPGMRARAKAVNFGIVYGQTAHGLADSLKIGNAEAQAMIDRYYAAYPRVRLYLDETVASAHRDGFAVTMFGRKRRIPELLSSNYNVRSFGERTAMNHPMQGSAADVMKLAMLEVDRRLRTEGLASRMVLQVHDELVFEAPLCEVERLTLLVREAMSGVADLAVPLDVSVASGADWASAK
ncbi:MAG: DNA polymerase I [Coriobacteriia bacterium]|nr:DNA polymerase I [Coriobacteriia bacterium]